MDRFHRGIRKIALEGNYPPIRVRVCVRVTVRVRLGLGGQFS